jgi:hypothetical protein
MKTIKHYEGIYEIKNFIDEQEIQLLLSKINVKSNEGWINSSPGNYVFFSYDKEFLECIDGINKKILSCFNNFDDSTGIQNIRRLKDGEFMRPHLDSGMPVKTHKPEEDDFLIDDQGVYIIFGIVLYLNNDFNGGETFYTDLGLKIYPTPGSLIVHRSDILHEVLNVTDGERYSISSFIKGNIKTSFIFK